MPKNTFSQNLEGSHLATLSSVQPGFILVKDPENTEVVPYALTANSGHYFITTFNIPSVYVQLPKTGSAGGDVVLFSMFCGSVGTIHVLNEFDLVIYSLSETFANGAFIYNGMTWTGPHF